MSAGAFLALLAAGAATSVPAPEGTYACTAQGMLASFRAGERWQATDKVQPKNNYSYQELRLAFLPGNRVEIFLPPDVLNMSGEYYLVTTKEGVTSWTASAPAYCGVIDAECSPMGAFLPDKGDNANLLLSTPVIVSNGESSQVGTVEVSYKCERAS